MGPKKPQASMMGGGGGGDRREVGQRNFIPELPPSQERDKTPELLQNPWTI